MKVIIVPNTPNKAIYKKYLKNDLPLRLYPAANMIGGNIKVKKISSSNFKVFAKLD